MRGSEVILGDESHITVYEQGGISTLGGVHSRTVPNNADGTMDLKKLEAAIRYELDDHLPVTRLICLENTQARYMVGFTKTSISFCSIGVCE